MSDARNSDDGVLEVRLGAVTKQMAYYRLFCKGVLNMSVDFPIYRPRRTRATENLRAMIRETEVSVKDLIYPIFVVPQEYLKQQPRPCIHANGQ